MLLNYHELAIDESRDSPARRKQFLVICAVIVTFTLHSVFTSGVLLPVDVQQATFPGGEFIYKHSRRDYAASMSLLHQVAGDLRIKERDYEDIMYNVYLDDPLKIMGRQQRFASGVLLNDSTKTTHQETNEERKSILMGKNPEITEPTPEEIKELPTYQLWEKLKYHSHEFPKVQAAVVQFPFTNGFVSALIHSYKVFPKIRKYAKEHGAPGTPVVLTTCSIKEAMCTHFVPLVNTEEFLLGQLNGDDYFATVGETGVVNWDGVQKMFWKIVTLGQGSKGDKKVSADDDKDEL